MSPRVFVRQLTAEECEQLSAVIRRGRDAAAVRRAQMVQLSSQGHSASQIAAMWQVTPQGVLKVIRRFNQEGLAGLPDRPRVGRPRKRTDRYIALLKEAVGASPRDLGYPFSAWTLERLREHLARRTRIVLCSAYLSRLMSENDIVYRRPKHGMTHLRDPQEYDEKKAFLEFVKKGRPGLMRPLTCSTSMSVRFTSTRP
jgi:transposase